MISENSVEMYYTTIVVNQQQTIGDFSRHLRTWSLWLTIILERREDHEEKMKTVQQVWVIHHPPNLAFVHPLLKVIRSVVFALVSGDPARWAACRCEHWKLFVQIAGGLPERIRQSCLIYKVRRSIQVWERERVGERERDIFLIFKKYFAEQVQKTFTIIVL